MQWSEDDGLAVTGPLAGTYFISAKTLLLRHPTALDRYHWLLHFVPKNWAAVGDFNAAFATARALHHPGGLDRDVLRRTAAQAEALHVAGWKRA